MIYWRYFGSGIPRGRDLFYKNNPVIPKFREKRKITFFPEISVPFHCVPIHFHWKKKLKSTVNVTRFYVTSPRKFKLPFVLVLKFPEFSVLWIAFQKFSSWGFWISWKRFQEISVPCVLVSKYPVYLFELIARQKTPTNSRLQWIILKGQIPLVIPYQPWLLSSTM